MAGAKCVKEKTYIIYIYVYIYIPKKTSVLSRETLEKNKLFNVTANSSNQLTDCYVDGSLVSVRMIKPTRSCSFNYAVATAGLVMFVVLRSEACMEKSLTSLGLQSGYHHFEYAPNLKWKHAAS